MSDPKIYNIFVRPYKYISANKDHTVLSIGDGKFNL